MKKILTILMLLIGILHAKEEILLDSANAYAITMKEVESRSVLAEKSKAIIIFPTVKKAGFIVGGLYGRGVAMIKDRNSGWSIVQAEIANGSIGFQIGYEDNYMVLFIMNDKTLNSILKSRLKLGVDATVSLYKASASVGAIDVFDKDIYAYVDKTGAFAGASFGGFVLNVETKKSYDPSVYGYENLTNMVNR
ncbi:MAG: lipid-binding SYLF domain-containing protein [Campylobacter sp.]|nr:lipid-binding SYLF domain-containing protein [Campylobacter sp.]